jgi:hypothetical protein
MLAAICFSIVVYVGTGKQAFSGTTSTAIFDAILT